MPRPAQRPLLGTWCVTIHPHCSPHCLFVWPQAVDALIAARADVNFVAPAGTYFAGKTALKWATEKGKTAVREYSSNSL